ncbi:MAG TPA: hypothetical protein ENN84_07260 [Candidatus Marinimicrobia bacterium]|nr:hypothetical protein [Candidatus Neomarinimicrobiota bacterium]
MITGQQLSQDQKEKLKKAAWLLLLLLGLILIFAYLGSDISSSEPKSQPLGDYSIWRVVFTVAVLLALFYFGARLYQKKVIQPENGTIRVLSRQYLDTKHYLALIEVEDERLLIGVSDASINLLKTVSTGADDSEDFSKLLQKAGGDESE